MGEEVKLVNNKVMKCVILTGENFVKELKAGYIEVEHQLKEQLERSENLKRRRKMLMDQILDMAKNDKVAMTGFLTSLGSQI